MAEKFDTDYPLLLFDHPWASKISCAHIRRPLTFCHHIMKFCTGFIKIQLVHPFKHFLDSTFLHLILYFKVADLDLVSSSFIHSNLVTANCANFSWCAFSKFYNTPKQNSLQGIWNTILTLNHTDWLQDLNAICTN